MKFSLVFCIAFLDLFSLSHLKQVKCLGVRFIRASFGPRWVGLDGNTVNTSFGDRKKLMAAYGG